MKTLNKVVGISLKDKTRVCFNSAKDAADCLHLDYSHILKCLKGTRKTHGGYSWVLEKVTKERFEILNSSKKECCVGLGDLVKTDISLFSNLRFTPEQWSSEEDEAVRSLYPTGNLSELVAKISKDVTSITMRARVLGLKRSKLRPRSRCSKDLLNIVVSSKDEVLS